MALTSVALREMTITNVSAIVVTYRRPDRLRKALLSIMQQRVLPKEIIVIDNSRGSDDATTKVCSELATKFERVGIQMMCFPSEENSPTVGRNLGISFSSGEIVFFLDDDATLGCDYFEEILECYSEHHDALGIQGQIIGEYRINIQSVSRINRTFFLNKMFFLPYMAKNTWRVLPSGNEVFPNPVTKTIRCMCLSGISSYRKSVFKKLRFDEKLKIPLSRSRRAYGNQGKYALREDIDFSYRLYKLHPGSLYLTPKAKAFHERPDLSRLPGKAEIFMETIHRLYFFFKNMEMSFSNIFALCLSMIGELILMTGGLLFKKEREHWRLIYLTASYIYALKQLRRIRRLDLEFFYKDLEQR